MKIELPNLSHEIPLWKKEMNVLGIDEAGRGAFAGPLAVAGVILDKNQANMILQLGINDSKLVSVKRREELYLEIKKNALFSHIELVNLDTINAIGIGKATIYGMQRVFEVANKSFKNLHLLIDAFKIPDFKDQNAIIHGDRISISIAAASILAKVERDKHMIELAKIFPDYGFERHKGYGTLKHRLAITKFGACKYHRSVFVSRWVR